MHLEMYEQNLVSLQGQAGSAERPRLSVYRSNNHIYGQARFCDASQLASDI